MRPQRQINKRPRKRSLLIQCEGVTEANYLDGLRREQDWTERFAVTIKEGKGGDANATVRAAQIERDKQHRRGEDYDEVWCVLDVEDVSRAAILKAAIMEAKQKKITLFLSNPSFEVWILAHFERTSRHFADGKSVETYLKQKHWNTKFSQEYNKSDDRIFDKLAPMLPAALQNAEQVLEKIHPSPDCADSNSSTEIYRLIAQFENKI